MISWWGVYSDRLKNRGLRHGSGQKRGVLGTGLRLEKRGVLGTGQVKKGGSLLRHIPVLGIYVSAPPPGACHAVMFAKLIIYLYESCQDCTIFVPHYQSQNQGVPNYIIGSSKTNH